MSERDAPKPKSVAEREARLAEALRRNLKRRKEQARGRDSGVDDERASRGATEDAEKEK